MLNSATATSVGTVSQIKGRNASLKLRLPICAEVEVESHSLGGSVLDGGS